MDNSKAAKAEFYQRYNSFLLTTCYRVCKSFDSGNELAEDIFQNTMLKAIDGIKSVYDKANETTTNLDKQIKRWLSSIAQNELNEFLRKNPDEKFLSLPDRVATSEIEIEFDLAEEPKDPVKNSQFGYLDTDKIMSVLSDRERYILMVYFNYYDKEEPNRHLPDQEIERLCKMFDINPPNLRQIKKRALKKLRDKNSNLIEKFS